MSMETFLNGQVLVSGYERVPGCAWCGEEDPQEGGWKRHKHYRFCSKNCKKELIKLINRNS